MLSLGVCLASREFTCPFCGKVFTRTTADLITLEMTLCDDCLAEQKSIDVDDLRAQVQYRLQAQKAPGSITDGSEG